MIVTMTYGTLPGIDGPVCARRVVAGAMCLETAAAIRQEQSVELYGRYPDRYRTPLKT